VGVGRLEEFLVALAAGTDLGELLRGGAVVPDLGMLFSGDNQI